MADEAENTQPEEQPQPTDSASEPTSEPAADSGAEEAVDDAVAKMDEVAAQADEGADVSDDEAAALAAAMSAISQVNSGQANPPKADEGAFESPEFGQGGSSEASSEIDLLSDVQMNVRIELGRTKMFVEDVLRLGDGAVVELDKLAGDPVDVFVNDRKVARGEVLVLNDNFCIRISEILDIREHA